MLEDGIVGVRDGQIVIRMPRAWLPVLGVAILAALAVLWSMDGQRRALEREAVELREERDAAVARAERERARSAAAAALRPSTPVDFSAGGSASPT